MPRTTTVESPGCPPLRALTFDVLGLVKVFEASKRENGGAVKMVERWGDPDSSKCVLSASILDRESDPLLGIARKCGSIEVISAINGSLRAHIPSLYETATSLQEDIVTGLHLFKKHRSESSSRSCLLHVCTRKGHVSLESIDVSKSSAELMRDPSTTIWNISGSGEILISRVDGSENYALYGGKGVEVNVWDLSNNTKTWTAKSPPKNSLGIFTPTWFTSATFLSKDDHRKFVAGTNSHQVRLYDISSQRRPVMSIDFRDTPIKSVAEDFDGHTIYVGNGSGDLGSIDMRTGKLLGCFIGKCSGSVRSIARHPELPILASCGLDSYLRIWDIHSRQLLSAVFLKQPLTNVFFDSHYHSEEIIVCAPEPQGTQSVDIVEEEPRRVKRKMGAKKHKEFKKMSTKKSSKRSKVEEH
ncbi:ribosome biogenesis protein NSA1 [Primulina huaijiensis]|uniref:ribosome biogenesis protein NSA1 n=1 Tax=Primulina huaijiensis TaxID=1492673 RepID=UPI003CC789F3